MRKAVAGKVFLIFESSSCYQEFLRKIGIVIWKFSCRVFCMRESRSLLIRGGRCVKVHSALNGLIWRNLTNLVVLDSLEV